MKKLNTKQKWTKGCHSAFTKWLFKGVKVYE